MTPEHRIMNEIRAWCGEHDILCFRANVGGRPTADGGWFSTGLPTGFPDLMCLCQGGRIVFVECKAPRGRLRPDQITFKRAVEARGFEYVVARSVDDILNIF